jgi:hypothetical protein
MTHTQTSGIERGQHLHVVAGQKTVFVVVVVVLEHGVRIVAGKKDTKHGENQQTINGKLQAPS